MTVPDFPPTQVVIDVPFDDEPRVTDDGGLAPYLIEAVLLRAAASYSTVWEVEFTEEDS